MNTILPEYPGISSMAEKLFKKSAFQKKKVESFLSSKSAGQLQHIETLLHKYTGYLAAEGMDIGYAVDAYLKMLTDMMRCQIYFAKKGVYPVADAVLAFDEVYSDAARMKAYMIGLALSQFLWESHFNMYQIFQSAINTHAKQIKKYLEIGPGHGLYFQHAMMHLDTDTEFTAVDISETSINITRGIIESLVENPPKHEFLVADIFNFNPAVKYDFITMGEVLEHVTNPEELLGRLQGLLAGSGRAFVSTCVNCPAIDHVYHFKHVEEISAMLVRCGFIIEEEHFFPVENLPLEEIIRQRITINYCAVVKKL
ncbi:MAG: methyltransferase domain-containing protein [Ignavibacteriales bacterium]|nr:methyltransferase domain-containing protein [Ignavibacteriales bacterium]